MEHAAAGVPILLDHLLEGCQIINFDWTYKYLNETALKHNRGTLDQFIGKPFKEMWPGIEKTKVYKYIRLCMDDRIHTRLDTEFTYPDGSKAWFSLSIQPVPEGVFILSIDITERKLFEQSIKESDRKFRNIFREHSAVKLIIDPQTGKINDANNAAADFYGWTRKELISMQIFDLNTLPKAELREEMQNVRNSIRNHFFFRHRLKSGEIRDVEVFSSLIHVGGKEFLHSIIHDITDKKKAEEQVKVMMNELVAAKTRAEESDRLKSAFLANMSHEIRTPMNGILGFMELLKAPDLTGEEREEYINLVQISGQRLMTTINDIIDISKIESGAVTLSESTFDLNRMLTNQLNLFRPEASERNIDLQLTSLLPYDKRMIITDQYKLESVIINLIKNALKFTPEGTVSFCAEMIGNNILIKVTDTGRGIPESRIEAIFDRFVQADVKNDANSEGSGLGLAISRGYAELMGGTLKAKSKPGAGSEFTLKIPYRGAGSPDQSPVFSTRQFTGKLNTLSVLIAEDDEISYKFMKVLLSKLNIDIIRVSNGLEAVEKVKNDSHISIVFMDVKMPVMDGYQSTAAIKLIRPALPVIAITAFGLVDDRQKALAAGCDDYLAKPVDKAGIVGMLMKYCTFR